MKTTIFVTFQMEGTHQWKECPYDDVAFLTDIHRHMFHFRCEREVFHDDRDVEFIKFKREIMNYMSDKYGDKECLKFVKMSCEMIAKELLNEFKLIKCEVSEDNENGAIVYGE